MPECAHKQFKANALRVAFGVHARPSMFIMVLIVFFATMALSWLLSDNYFGATRAMGLMGLIIIPLLISLLIFNTCANHNRAVQLTLTEHGLGIKTLFGVRREIPWHHIREIKYERLPRAIRITTYLEAFQIGGEMQDFDAVCEQLAAIRERGLIGGNVSLPVKGTDTLTEVVPKLQIAQERLVEREVDAP